jgi:hypothetical protein
VRETYLFDGGEPREKKAQRSELKREFPSDLRLHLTGEFDRRHEQHHVEGSSPRH